jgi:hypothetical protein
MGRRNEAKCAASSRICHSIVGTPHSASVAISDYDDVTFGYGLLATIHKGSSFATTRDAVAPTIWKTTSISTHFDGRALFFKTIGRQQRSIHRDFQPLPADLSIHRAVELLTR